MRAATLGILAALFLLLSGCAVPGPPPELTPLPPVTNNVATTPEVNANVGATTAAPTSLVSYGVPPVNNVPVGEALPTPEGNISLDFADTDIREVVAQILGRILRVNYTIDPAVHGTASLRTVRPLTREQLLPTLQTLLAGAGAVLVRANGIYRVVPSGSAGSLLAVSPDLAGSVVVPLRYVSAATLARTLAPFVGPTGRIVPEPGSNALIVSGNPDTREALRALVESFDTDALAGQSYALLSVPQGGAKEFATALEGALRAEKGEALAERVNVLPLERVNAVLAVAAEPSMIADVQRVYALLQRSELQNRRTWHVYYLQNTNANDTAYVLQQAFTPNDITAQPPESGRVAAQQMAELPSSMGFGASQPGATAPGGGTTPGGTATPGETPAFTPAAASTGGAAGGGQPASGGGGNPLLGGLDVTATGTGAGAATESMRIIPNDENNALLIYANQQEYGTLEAMLNKIDILPLQVKIDAVIAEVTLNDALQYGTQFFFKAGGVNGILSNASQSLQTSNLSAAQFATGFPGFVIGGNGLSGAPLAISALQAVTKVQVLSSPELMVLDNHPAELQVGSLVPYLTQTSQSTLVNNAPVINSVSYAQTGVVMIVTPRVNAGGLVTLDISQQVSEVDTNPPAQAEAVNSPTFLDRTVHSRVVVQDGQTVGLAGLITDNVSNGNQGIPWLKDIPLIGALAGTQNNQRQRTELLVLITPHVIHDQRDARALTQDMREQLINAALVPQELRVLPASGSSDPNQRLRQRVGHWISNQ